MDTSFDAIGGTVVDPVRHRVADCLWVAGLRNRLVCPDLFVYQHMVHGTWVLAKWLRKPADGVPGKMLELDFGRLPMFADNPDNLDSKLIPTDEEVAAQLRFESEILKEATEMERRRREQLALVRDRSDRHRKDVVKFMKKQAGIHRSDSEPITDLERGMVPWTTPEEAEAEFGKDVKKFLTQE